MVSGNLLWENNNVITVYNNVNSKTADGNSTARDDETSFYSSTRRCRRRDVS